MSREAAWISSMNALVLRVTRSNQRFLLFSITSRSPTTPQNSLMIKVSCLFCIADLPDRLVESFSTRSLLSFQDIPLQACTGTKFGPDCSYDCRGFIVKDKCICPTGIVGFQCDQVGTRDSETSSEPQLVSPSRDTQVTSTAGIGVKIPSGAIKGDEVIVSVDVYNIPAVDLGPQKDSVIPAGPLVIFEPSGIFFETEVEIFTPFDPSSIPAGKIPCIFYQNDSAFPPWQRQDSAVVPGKNLTRALVRHFSAYMTMAVDPLISSSLPQSPSSSAVSIPGVSTPVGAFRQVSGMGLILGLTGGGVGLLALASMRVMFKRRRKRRRVLSLQESNTYIPYVHASLGFLRQQ